MKDKLNYKEYQTIFDVLNVYDPNEIKHVYPEMGEKEFLSNVKSSFKKVRSIIAKSPQRFKENQE